LSYGTGMVNVNGVIFYVPILYKGIVIMHYLFYILFNGLIC